MHPARISGQVCSRRGLGRERTVGSYEITSFCRSRNTGKTHRQLSCFAVPPRTQPPNFRSDDLPWQWISISSFLATNSLRDPGTPPLSYEGALFPDPRCERKQFATPESFRPSRKFLTKDCFCLLRIPYIRLRPLYRAGSPFAADPTSASCDQLIPEAVFQLLL